MFLTPIWVPAICLVEIFSTTAPHVITMPAFSKIAHLIAVSTTYQKTTQTTRAIHQGKLAAMYFKGCTPQCGSSFLVRSWQAHVPGRIHCSPSLFCHVLQGFL